MTRIFHRSVQFVWEKINILIFHKFNFGKAQLSSLSHPKPYKLSDQGATVWQFLVEQVSTIWLFRRPLCPRYINVSKNYHVGQSQVLPHDHIWEIHRLVPATKSHKTVLTEPVTSWYLLKSGNQVIFFLAKIHLLSWKCESLLHQVSSSRLPAYFPFFNWPRRYVYLHQRLLVSTFLNE